MIVKCQTFRTTTFYKSATQRSGYLEAEGRAIGGVTTQNIVENDDWFTEMDRTTARAHLRGNVIAREFVLSSSPEDAVTPERMRDFAHEWLSLNFPNAEAAVVIHTDNKERTMKGLDGITHAHVYVNAVDLETGKKITLDNTRVRAIHDSAQELSRERGWSEQDRYYDLDTGKVRTIKSQRDHYERRPKYQRLEERANPEYERSAAKKTGIDRHEFEAQRQGRTFEKTHVRRELKEAVREVSENGNITLKDALAKRGITIERAADGDYKYRREDSRYSFKGATLGKQYERSQLENAIKRQRELSRSGLSLS